MEVHFVKSIRTGPRYTQPQWSFAGPGMSLSLIGARQRRFSIAASKKVALASPLSRVWDACSVSHFPNLFGRPCREFIAISFFGQLILAVSLPGWKALAHSLTPLPIIGFVPPHQPVAVRLFDHAVKLLVSRGEGHRIWRAARGH